MSAAPKTIPLIVSRRALQRLTPKYPQHFKDQTKRANPTVESSWPKSMQIAAYAAIAIAIPYSFCATVAESPRFRDRLEGGVDGDDTNPDSIGKKIVRFVRWNWGEEDRIPYSEYIELKEDEWDEVSLETDVNTVERAMEEKIQQAVHAGVKVIVEDLDSEDGRQRIAVIPGTVAASDVHEIWKSAGLGGSASEEDEPERVYLSFEDDEGKDDVRNDNNDGMVVGESKDDAILFESRSMKHSSAEEEIEKSTTIWSAWHYFPNTGAASSASSSSSSSSSSTPKRQTVDVYQMSIEKLKYQISMLQKDVKDPSCTRDRDDMQEQIAQLKRDLGALKRERRMKKFKSFIPF
mmetsp:Transcript_11852/g.17302  ORF Transcript_11852/g.17302 Transcript_11852/m.17302 type:complete len:349 (+) Transcript_11852:265-1311(+)